MFLRSVLMDGFKCYRKSTLIDKLDPKFTAITGMNGAGKSNIIDAIVFGLDLTYFKTMRINSLKELINTNRKECSVTLYFDNKNKSRSPVGYEHLDRIEITRMLDFEGKSKYRINRHNCTKKTIEKMCKSVGISNEFVIMQGHITKVINMKNSELRGMIEEAAGTKSYISEKDRALEVLEKKEKKLREVSEHLHKNVSPYLSELLHEKKIYEENKAFEKKKEELGRELRRCKEIIEQYETREGIKELESRIKEYIMETEQLERLESQLREIREANDDTVAMELKKNMRSARAMIECSNNETIEELAEKKREYAGIENNVVEVRAEEKEELIEKERILSKEMTNNLGTFKIDELERLREEINGLESNFNGKWNILEEIKDLTGEIESSNGYKKGGGEEKDSLNEVLVKMSNVVKSVFPKTQSEGNKIRNLFLQASPETASICKNMKNAVEEAKILLKENEKKKLVINDFNIKCEKIKAKLNYPMIDGVYGTVDENMEVCDKRFDDALAVIIGGRAKFVICENDIVAGKVVEMSERPVSCIPLNKIVGGGRLRSDVGGINALDLIRYNNKLEGAFKYVFGEKYVFEKREDARKACYEKKVVCVTLDGSVYDPRGRVTGGRVMKMGEIFRGRKVIEMEAELGKIFVMNEFTEKRLRSALEIIAEIVTICEELGRKRGRIELLEGICESRVDVTKELEKVRRRLEIVCGVIKGVEEANERRSRLETEIATLEEEIRRYCVDVESAQKEYKRCDAALQKIYEKKLVAQISGNVEEIEGTRNTLLKTQLKMRKKITNLANALGSRMKEAAGDKYGKKCSVVIENERFLSVIEEFGIDQELFKDVDSVELNEKEAEELRGYISRLNFEFEKKGVTSRMDPTNFEMLEKNVAEIQELEKKLVMLESDKIKIKQSMEIFLELGIEENRKAFDEINKNLKQFFGYFDESLEVKITDNFEIKVGDKSLSELSGGQRSLIALCLVFSMLAHRPAPFYIFDEIDSALDLNYTQGIGEIIKKEFTNAQFIIISLKNNMFQNANKIYKVVLQDNVPMIYLQNK